eukprot:6383971-Ditylum_brightwellii.AAC.1
MTQSTTTRYTRNWNYPSGPLHLPCTVPTTDNQPSLLDPPTAQAPTASMQPTPTEAPAAPKAAVAAPA